MENIRIGPGLVTSLTILFVILKVFDKVSWNWWIVFSPILISVSIVLLIVLIGIIAVIIAALMD